MAQDHLLNLQPGTVVNGRYEIVKCLGTGSMGMVYACRHRELAGHLVAMKVLFSEVARDDVSAARFRNEIVASYGVSHPNVVRAYEYFKDGEIVAFTMEYIGGGDLADRLNEEEPIEIGEAIRMFLQMCSGVQAIHSAGIIHRDLKPENILITDYGDIKITDFGIARTGTGPKLTEHGGVVGTIDYVSPEYLEKGQVDHRSDIYALGILGYEMVTGQAPFKGKTVIETMTMRLKSDPALPMDLRPDCPQELNDIIMHAMARDSEKRYQSAEEMLADLKKLESIGLVNTYKDGTRLKQQTKQEERERNPSLPQSSYNELLEGTLSLEDEELKDMRNDSNFQKEIESYYRVARLDSVLRPQEKNNDDDHQNLSNVSISNSNLSVDRVKELFSDLYPAVEEKGSGTFIGWFLGGLVVLGVLIFLLGRYSPSTLEVIQNFFAQIIT
jgi:serine/threonine protein kinase